MGDATAAETAPRYRAFISYSHADAAFAQRLHRRLETFRLPGGDRLRPVFIDRAELVAAPDLTVQVRAAIAESAALIVVASPAARLSRWVAQEIALFRELHPQRPILAVICAGTPEEAFPDALVHHGGQRIEPLAADFRKGHDGPRLGLLKLVAGLGLTPLDALVQRDAQARYRRVMVVTAAALLLSLVLAGLLIAALRARTEAEERRAETEGMVEFMLTDLRGKLKGVGRLDIMGTVNARAMEHYAAERDLRGLPADTLARRARLLSAMAEDDLNAGRTAQAASEFVESSRITADLLRRAPHDPENLFNHAQNEFWLGEMAFRAGDRAVPRKRWASYRALAERLAAAEPGNVRGKRELGYAEGNLCALALVQPIDLPAARRHCAASSAAMAEVARAKPGDLDTMLDFANRMAWEADAQFQSGSLPSALALRDRQTALIAQAAAAHPQDYRVAEAQMLAELGRALLYETAKQPHNARAAAAIAASSADRLIARDPANRGWLSRRSQIGELQARVAAPN